MRVKTRFARTRAIGAAFLVVLGCGGRAAEPKPVAVLPSSPLAGMAFDAIREAWTDEGHDALAALRGRIESFLSTFPNDGLVPLARIALALTALQSRDFSTADAELERTAAIPIGSAHDLWTVARARRLRLGGDPEAALGLLRPLAGKSVDPLGRIIFEEELTLATLETHREYEAISYMDAWLRATAEEERAATAARVAALVERLPKDVLVGALEAMRAERTRFGYGADIERILSQRLVQIATRSGDAALARLLLEGDPGGLSVEGDAGATLGELATSRRGLNVVLGRTVGLLLPTASPELRDESADVLRGVMWALGLPRGVRRSPRPTVSVAAAPPVLEMCKAPETAPDLDEPHPSEKIRLVTRDDAGSADRAEVALDELLGDGAAIVIAGLDGLTSARALGWGQEHRIPVITLVEPQTPADAGATGFAFLLGEPRGRVMAALASAAQALSSDFVAPVVDASQLARYAPQGGTLDGIRFAPPSSCEMPSVRAGDPRFPVTQWERTRVHAWFVDGSPGCARDVVAELQTARATGIVALTLEAAALVDHAPSLRLITAQAGAVPAIAGDDPRADERARFGDSLGSIGWWAALGRDAATLARVAVRNLPTTETADPTEVAERRIAARDSLAAVRTHLWSTEAAGWETDHQMRRTVCATNIPPFRTDTPAR